MDNDIFVFSFTSGDPHLQETPHTQRHRSLGLGAGGRGQGSVHQLAADVFTQLPALTKG